MFKELQAVIAMANETNQMVTRYESTNRFARPSRDKSHAFLAKATVRTGVFAEVAKRYRRRGAAQVVDVPEIQKLGHRLIVDDLLEEHGVIRHNRRRLARLLAEEFLSTADAPAAMPTGRVAS
ncbi:MAG TPA: hypothetical protein VJN92_14430 [Candidatus Acidoferrum sp.]|nr:hypothetical protein [Candidatus Acidoferrum sp.]